MTYWSAWAVGLLLILVFPAIAVLAQIGIRRAWPRLAEGEHNDVAGFIIAVVGVIYAVLLAFVVIVSWEKFNSAESVVGQEASALRSIYRESVAFPPEARAQLGDDVSRYASAVIKQEWPAMASTTPRFLISMSTCSQCFAPSPPSPAQIPRTRCPSTVTPMTT